MHPQTKGQFCFIILQIFTLVKSQSQDFRVVLTSDGPITRGATITFFASLYYGDRLASGSYEYFWSDDAMPSHQMKMTSTFPIVSWEVKFDLDYPPGRYEVQVIVKKIFFLIPYEVTSARLYFTITDTVHGQLQLSQKNSTRDKYISTADPLIHFVNLTQPDAKYIANATSVTTFWFIDCIYYGPTNNGQFSHLFPISGEQHTIDALMVADFNPPPPPPTTTTTTTTTTTVKPTTSVTTIKPNTTTVTTKSPVTTTTNVSPHNTTLLPDTASKQLVSVNSHSKALQKRSASVLQKTQNLLMNVNGTLRPYNGSFPFICNGTVAVDEKKKYGYFSKTIIAKSPISSVNVTGNNWLQHGDILTLNVLCDGAPSLRYCVDFKRGSYNTTGNETCPIFLNLETCSFLIQRYLGEAVEHTVIIIIQNDVTKVVKSVAVTVYKVKKQAQLSVIVVPVAFSLFAVVLIVFGVAYYIQNRRRFIVEVADFNFGVDYADMEYKTFRERLQESFINAFTRAPSPEPSEAPNWPPGHCQKYGSMT